MQHLPGKGAAHACSACANSSTGTVSEASGRMAGSVWCLPGNKQRWIEFLASGSRLPHGGHWSAPRPVLTCARNGAASQHSRRQHCCMQLLSTVSAAGCMCMGPQRPYVRSWLGRAANWCQAGSSPASASWHVGYAITMDGGACGVLGVMGCGRVLDG